MEARDYKAIKSYMLGAYASLLLTLLGLGIGIIGGDFKFAYMGLLALALVLVINTLHGLFYIALEEYEDYKEAERLRNKK